MKLLFNIIYFVYFQLKFIYGNNTCKFLKGIMRYYYCFPDDELTLNYEEIDVVIKYIDLSEMNFKPTKKYPSIKSSNGEIKYCVRSILKNIPWINKIYILTSNEKIKFLKDSKEINKKIIFIKDKVFLGFDYISENVFQFNLWRLKNFGVSENFIYMNDYYFIGNQLKKIDFFYIENGKVVPYLLINNEKINKTLTEEIYYKLYPIISKKKNLVLDNEKYIFHLFETRLFIFKLFGNYSKIITKSPNSFGENILENEEIYNIILNNYKYSDDCLKNSNYRLHE